jgi:ubiquinone/menaquinone biosynthesis C-methylase UbiE
MQDFIDANRITIDTYQQIAPLYADVHKSTTRPPFWRQRLQRFADALRSSPAYQANPALPVLDMGCGPGLDSLLLAQMGFNMLAADLSAAMLDEAHKRCQGQPGVERITFRCMDMHRIDLAGDSCAGLWISASFLHIPKRENLLVLKELVRVLAPGGPVMLLVKESDSEDDERYEVHKENGKLRFFARYHGSGLWALLEQAGLQVLEITTAVDKRFSDGRRWLGALAVKPYFPNGATF